MSADPVQPPSLLRAAEDLRERSVDLLTRLTGLDAPSGNREALEPVADLLAAELARLGSEPIRHRTPAGTHLEARFGPEGDDPIMLLCHYDTVWPKGTAASRPIEIREGVASGPGVFDMRGGLVAGFGAIEILSGGGGIERPLIVLTTADEETGGRSSRELIVDRGRDARCTLVPEPPLPGGALKTRRKGWSTYELQVRGRQAHAGLDPERGVSAIDELVDQLRVIGALADPAAGTTINCGTVSGGSAVNVVADAAEALIDLRVATTAEFERVERALSELVPNREGAEVVLDQVQSRPPMERTPPIAAAAARARELAARLGITLEEGSAGGASDGNHLAALGASVLDGLGPEGGGAHAENEHVALDSMIERAGLLALLISEL